MDTTESFRARGPRRRAPLLAGAVLGAALIGGALSNAGARPATATLSSTTSSTLLPASAMRPLPTGTWWGVTVDDASDATKADGIVAGAFSTLVAGHPMPMTRIVFDRGVPRSAYVPVVQRLQPTSYLMGELVDSSVMKYYTQFAYKVRTKNFLATFGNSVDLWEVGNEVNGEWTGKTSAVVAKVSNAFDQVKAAGRHTALTLYYNPNCWTQPDHEMFTWAQAQLPARVKQGVDVVLISYYEDDCNSYQPSQQQWQQVFDQLHSIFPNSALGFGETGTHSDASVAHKQDTMQRYYGLHITGDNYIGGYFWWYYAEDCLPATKAPLWPTLMSVLPSQ